MAHETFLNGKVQLCCGDSLHFLRDQPDNRYDSIVSDPPYALVSIVKRFADSPRNERTENVGNPYGRTGRGFMGKRWDTGETAFAVEFWEQCLRVLKPGGHVVAFGGTRTYHRLACAIEDAGFEIRDMVSWTYGSGFPKSHDVSKGIDRAAGAERAVLSKGAPVKRMIPGADQNKAGWEKNNGREYVPLVTVAATDEAAQWEGWGTALKPAVEPICLARKPLVGTVAENVLQHGVGALNIDGCRVDGEANRPLVVSDRHSGNVVYGDGLQGSKAVGGTNLGRWPANLVHDGSDEVIAAFPDAGGGFGKRGGQRDSEYRFSGTMETVGYGDEGSAARFFYTAKADSDDRIGSKHPTVKPVDLMQWLVRLVTPKYVPYCFDCEENVNAPLERKPEKAKASETVRGVRDAVRPVRSKIKSGEKVLQPTMPEQVHSQKPEINEGVRDLEKGVSPSLDAGSSTIESAGGVHIRASLGSSTESGAPTDLGRGGASYQRGENRQSTGEPSTYEEGRARRFELATAEHITLSALRGTDHHQSPCPVCGAARLLRRGIVLDPFAGTGTTAEACFREGMRCMLVERETEYQADIRRRMGLVLGGPEERRRESIKAKMKDQPVDAGPLFQQALDGQVS